MNKYTMYFFTNCTDPTREEEYNSWYSHVHLPDLSKAIGLLSAKRYTNQDPHSRAKYLAVYEFETERIQESLKSFFQLVRRYFEVGRHIDCIESINTINTPFVACYKEIDPKEVEQLPCIQYLAGIPKALDAVEDLVRLQIGK